MVQETSSNIKQGLDSISVSSPRCQSNRFSTPTSVNRSEARTCRVGSCRSALQPHEGSSETMSTSTTSSPKPTLQPHEGSSETASGTVAINKGVCFNPTRVRLKPVPKPLRGVGRFGFNPTRVRLKPAFTSLAFETSCSFNPTRVRLKRRLPDGRARPTGASTPRGFV